MDVRHRDRHGLPLEHGSTRIEPGVFQDEIIDLDLFLSRILLLRFRLGGVFRRDGFAERRNVLLYLADVAAGRAAFVRDLGAVNQDLLDDELVRQGDRKSTRLNSSHSSISYAVFCLKKKKKNNKKKIIMTYRTSKLTTWLIS